MPPKKAGSAKKAVAEVEDSASGSDTEDVAAPKSPSDAATKKRGRSPDKKVENRGAHLRVPDDLKKKPNVYVPTGKPRGRPPGKKVENRGAHFRKKPKE